MRFPHVSAGTLRPQTATDYGAGLPVALARFAQRMRTDRRIWLPILVGALVMVAVAASTPAVPALYFVVSTPHGRTGAEVFLALNLLFIALVLYLFAESAARPRLIWLSLGCVILATGGLIFGGLLPMLSAHENRINVAMFASILSRTCGIGCMALGMAPRVPPVPTRRRCAVILGLYLGLLALLLATGPHLPHLTSWSDLTELQSTARTSRGVLPGLTPWHWTLSSLPLLLITLTADGIRRHLAPRSLGDWLLLATVLLGGAQLCTLLCPSAYSSIVTLATLLQLAFTGVLAIGAILALSRISAQRAAMLASEREVSARLTDLTMLRADFSAMVAHELSSPLAAIRRSTELLATDPPDHVRAHALDAIETGIGLLDALVKDVRAASAAEREDFTVDLRAVPLDEIVADAVAFARTLSDNLVLRVELAAHPIVRADARRIGQVLRNLLGNAAKFSPAGAPTTLRTRVTGDRVRIEIVDAGPGIHPDDLQRVFEKFGRGRDAVGQHVPGVGLGLYLSRRIVRSHGGELTVASAPGQGATFAFDLGIEPGIQR